MEVNNSRLLKGLSSGYNFFDILLVLGYRTLIAISVFSSFVFWVFMAVYISPGFTELGIFIVKVIQIFFIMTVVGFLFKIFISQIYEYFYKKELSKIDEKCQKSKKKTKKNLQL